MHIISLVYGDPDHLPPMINASYILNDAGFSQQIFSPAGYALQDIQMPSMNIEYPALTTVTRITTASGSSLRAYASFIWAVLRAKHERADIFIGHNMHGLLPATLLAAIYRRPLVYHCHDFVENGKADTLGQRIVKICERLFAPMSKLVIVPDRGRAEVIAKQLRLRQFPLIVANAPLKSKSGRSTTLQDRLASNGQAFSRIVLRQGNVGPGHVLENTIRSIPAWGSSDWGFVIIGPVRENYKKELVRLAEDCGVEDRVILLPPVNYSELRYYTEGAHLGHGMYAPFDVNAKFNTTASNKVFEYMAASLPIILGDTPGNRTLLAECRNGIVADIDSPQSIANAVNTILGDDQLARQMGERSRQAFENEYNYAHQYAPVIERLRELVDSPAPVVSHGENPAR